MVVLGIDPGSRAMGWGLVRCVGGELAHIDHGIFRPKAKELTLRLGELYDEVARLVALHRPDVGAVEDVFQNKNVRSAIVLASARTSAVLALVHGSVQVFSYTPAQVKKAVTGGGRAEKGQVAEMVRFLLALQATPASDAGDALGVALCHGMRAPMLAQLQVLGA